MVIAGQTDRRLVALLPDERQIGGTSEWLHRRKGKHDDIIITGLQLASHRAHWVKMTGDTLTDEPDFHEFKGMDNFLETLTK
jgi:hypothetical protein